MRECPAEPEQKLGHVPAAPAASTEPVVDSGHGLIRSITKTSPMTRTMNVWVDKRHMRRGERLEVTDGPAEASPPILGI